MRPIHNVDTLEINQRYALVFHMNMNLLFFLFFWQKKRLASIISVPFKFNNLGRFWRT